jgi:DNA repair protein RadC
MLKASPNELRAVPGIGDTSVLLLKVVGRLALAASSTPKAKPDREGKAGDAPELLTAASAPAPVPHPVPQQGEQASGVQRSEPPASTQEPKSIPAASTKKPRPARRRQRTGLFSNGLLKDAVGCLPKLPDTDSVEQISTFLRDVGLHYSGAQTRERFAHYITARIFPDGRADRAIRAFAQRFGGHQELRDACYYRFLKAEPLLQQIVQDLFLPAAASGGLLRARLREYLTAHFPAAKPNATKSCSWAIAEILGSAGVAVVARNRFSLSLRDVRLESFAFVLHSEFPEPGMYDVAKVERGDAFRAMFWRPDALLPGLYELRNRRWISKVSEIDTVRQFTTRYTLEQLVACIVGEGGWR